MSILIKEMDMPKSCVDCQWYYELYDEDCTLGNFLLREYSIDASEEPYTLDVQRHPNCSLIEIVRCEECKYREKNHYCVKWGQPYLCKDGAFCSYGERKE